jgi:hypothetical protein
LSRGERRRIARAAQRGEMLAVGVGMLLHSRRLAENLERAERLNSR